LRHIKKSFRGGEEGIKALFDIGLRDFSPYSNILIFKEVMVISAFAMYCTPFCGG
jgi:hypothetical protein